jgi:hypothetical protein
MPMDGYEIHVRGRLGPEMRSILADLEPCDGPGVTILHTAGTDQAALHGAFARVSNLGLEIDRVVSG